jgi:potassium-transporting ATPase potassium-binding subunit
MPWLNAVVFLAALLCLAYPLARYLQATFQGERTWLTPVLGPVERAIYRLCGIDPATEMSWGRYAGAAIALTLAGTAVLYVILRTQLWLPLNPQHFANLSPDLAWNAALSFATTTDWQFYSGENALSYLSQMTGMAWQNFVAGAIGLAAGVAVIRGFARSNASTLGNFWVDVVRSLLYVLLPLSVAFGLTFAFLGIPQNFSAYTTITNAERFQQSITGGPIASQEAPKLLGGNGGGFVNANSSSPNENPSGVSNFVELLAIWLLPAAFPLLFGFMIGKRRAGFVLLGVMIVLAAASFAGAQFAEQAGNPIVHSMGVAGGNMEGKELRFGVANAGLSLAVASDSGTGSSNFAYDSLTPLGGLLAMVNLQLSEVVFGGVGSGLYGLLVFAVLTVFMCGLMVGRTPEYLGKRIERREVQFSMLALLMFAVLALVPAAVAAVIPAGTATLGTLGPHGLSEILYAFASNASNNGSAFAGLGPNLFYEFATGIVMLGGRFLVMIPTLALAGSLAQRPTNVRAAGTFRTDDAFFGVLLIAVVILVGALTFLPADILGPVAEHVLLQQGHTF